MAPRAPSDAGFSLIEALVALVVLGVAGIAFVGAAETHVQRIGALEDRAAAQLVAENRMAELSAGAVSLRDATDVVAILGTDWRVRQSVGATDDPDLMEVAVTVRAPDRDDTLARLTGFIVAEDIR